MKKQQSVTEQKTRAFELRKETLRRLDPADLRERVAGGGRLRVPVGYADDTTPIYGD